MGLFSKLLGDIADKGARELIGGLVNEAAKPEQAQTQPAQSSSAPAQPQVSAASSGFSWGDTMPQEENQYSFNGPYHEYFDKVFREQYPEYDISKEVIDKRNATVFTFTNNGSTALKVEILSQSASPWKIRSDCAKLGIAYLRFYHNHHGWWNTKAYVVSRVNKALGK